MVKVGNYTTIDEYISLFTPEIQEILQKIRKTIHEAAPDAIEKISYQMPCFWQTENLIYFAAAKKHIGIYPTSGGVAAFADRLRLSGYRTSKGTIQFRLDKPVDYKLIAEITQFRVNEVLAKQRLINQQVKGRSDV